MNNLNKVIRRIIKEELNEMARPRKGMGSPEHSFGDKVTLKFTTNDKRNNPEYEAAHGKKGRIYNIEDTPNGSFYVVRLFNAVRDRNNQWHEKIHKITDKNIK